MLADLGASIDKLEDPRGGDYLRAYPPFSNDLSTRFAALNRDKRSLALDLKHPGAAQMLARLVRGYDIIIESFRPGVLARLHCDYATLSKANPRLILCSISGYGQTGPLAARAGHDLDFLALGGVLSFAKSPAPLPVQVADLAGGALYGAVGILAALYRREQTGVGAHVDVSMCEGAASFLLAELDGGGDDLLTGGSAGYAVYRTRDDRHLAVAPLEPKFLDAFNRALSRSGPMTHEELSARFLERTLDEWLAIFSSVDACVEAVLTLDEVRQHPQHRARDLFFAIEGREYMRTATATRRSHHAAPALGQHSRDVLRDAGFSDDEIATLTQARAITHNG